MIAIIGAMDEEIDVIKDKMDKVVVKEIANITFYRGELSGKDIVLMKSLIGKVSSGMSTTILCENFKPDFMINIGSAGGLLENAVVGDVVIGQEVGFHDVDLTAFGYSKGVLPSMPKSFVSDKMLVQLAVDSLKQEDISYHVGKIVTGDQFIASNEQITNIKADFPDAIATEMEAGAIALVASQYEIPYVIIRALSDVANNDAKTDFKEYLKIASENSGRVVQRVVKNIM